LVLIPDQRADKQRKNSVFIDIAQPSWLRFSFYPLPKNLARYFLLLPYNLTLKKRRPKMVSVAMLVMVAMSLLIKMMESIFSEEQEVAPDNEFSTSEEIL